MIGFYSSNTSVVACQDMGPPKSNWTTAAATLDTKHLTNCNTASPLTGAQVSAALAGFGGIFVFAGNLDSVSETVDVDNAELAGPEAARTAPTGSVTRRFTLTFSRRTFRGTLTAKNDYSCAGKTKVTIFRKATTPVRVGTTATSGANRKEQFGPATFSLTRKTVVKGTYYASVPKTKSSRDGNTCRAARSKTVSSR